MTKKHTPVSANPGTASRRSAPGAAELTEARLRKMPESAYMNEVQLAFFRSRLKEMRQEVVVREVDARQRLGQNQIHADPADRATAEEEYFLDMRLREREARLLHKIDEALQRIHNKEYGFCTQTGEPIGIARLLVRPTASVCVEVKDREERQSYRG